MKIVEAAEKYFGDDPEVKPLLKALKQAGTTEDPDKLHELSKHPHRYVQDAVADNLNTEYRSLVGMNNIKALRRVAESHKTSQAKLDELASHPDEGVRDRVAYSSKRGDTLRQLAQDKSPNVRWTVVHNKKIPPETHELLANDPAFTVRLAVADETNDHKLLHKMATRPGEEQMVRYSIASHGDVHPDTLDFLAKDPSRYVRQAVHDNPRTRESTRRSIKLK